MSTTNSSDDRGIFALTVSELCPTLAALQRYGVTLAHLDMLRANNGDNGYAKRFARALTRDSFETSTDIRVARAILGASIFDVADWVEFYGARFSEKEARKAFKFPWHEDVLLGPCPFYSGKLVKDTHFAFFGLPAINGQPLTVAQWVKLHPDTSQPKFYLANNLWHEGQPHIVTATMQPRWYLMLNQAVPNSTGKTPEEQVATLPPGYKLPTTIAEVTKDILFFRKAHDFPNYSLSAACEECTVETSKIVSDLISYVGPFDSGGLHVSEWDGSQANFIGAGASRELPVSRS